MPSMVWFQCGSCSGDSMSLLCSGMPGWGGFVRHQGIDLLYHPSLTLAGPRQLEKLVADRETRGEAIDILVIEGSLLRGPHGTGAFDTLGGEPKIRWVERLAALARHVVAVGTCAAYGGVTACSDNPTDSTGLQFLRYDCRGGLLPHDWRAAGGYPVINLPGCPTHPTTILQCVEMLVAGIPLALDEYQRPKALFNQVVHQGCTRNEYHEYGAEEKNFGGKGCLFFNLGCQGPRTHGSCNSILWNEVSSKPRAGVPCLGCTEPHFPADKPLLQTEKIGPIPVRLPLGVKRANYLAYKGLAHSAAPERVEKREMEP